MLNQSKKRVLTCSFIALTTGFFVSYLGGQINLAVRSYQCQQNNFWGLPVVCKLVMTPGAVLQGTTTGLWVGTILGAFAGGVLTRKGNW